MLSIVFYYDFKISWIHPQLRVFFSVQKVSGERIGSTIWLARTPTDSRCAGEQVSRCQRSSRSNHRTVYLFLGNVARVVQSFYKLRSERTCARSERKKWKSVWQSANKPQRACEKSNLIEKHQKLYTYRAYPHRCMCECASASVVFPFRRGKYENWMKNWIAVSQSRIGKE